MLLDHHYMAFEFSFGRAFDKLINFFLNLLADLLVSTFLAYPARDILDLNKVGLHDRSAQISPRCALWAFPWHGFDLTSAWIHWHRCR